jgi:hypothetical protein
MSDVVSDQARAEACAIVREHASDRAALVEAIALRIQHYIDCAELAEVERKAAVNTANSFSRRVSDTAQTALIPEWVSCPRCGARAESTLAIQHRPHCRHSSAPPAHSNHPPSDGQKD